MPTTDSELLHLAKLYSSLPEDVVIDAVEILESGNYPFPLLDLTTTLHRVIPEGIDAARLATAMVETYLQFKAVQR